MDLAKLVQACIQLMFGVEGNLSLWLFCIRLILCVVIIYQTSTVLT